MKILTEMQQQGLINPISDCMPRNIDLNRNFSVKIDKRGNVESTIRNLPNGTSRWYTDGSRTDQGTGIGVYGPRIKRSVALGQTPTIFQAETYAINLCALLCLQRGYNRTEIYIMSDSQSAIRALGSTTFNSKLVWKSYKNLQLLSANNRVTLMRDI